MENEEAELESEGPFKSRSSTRELDDCEPSKRLQQSRYNVHCNIPPIPVLAPTGTGSLMILRIRARSLFVVQGRSREPVSRMLRGCLSRLDLPAESRKFLPLASRVPERAGTKKECLT